MSSVSHWDEVARETMERIPHLRATWQDLGRAAGAVGASVQRVRIAAGCRPAPVHQHFDEEEHVVVLGGSGWSWQDGLLHPIAEGDVILHRAGEEAHTLLAADHGLDVLIFGAEPPAPVTFLPRARLMRTGGWWVPYDPDSPHPFDREPADLPGEVARERPGTICTWTDPPTERGTHGHGAIVRRRLGGHLGATRTGLQYVVLPEGEESFPPHCHSAEEEIFVILDGGGTVVVGDREIPVRRGSCVARPPGTGVAHHFVGPLTYLAWSTRDPRDTVYYPRSRKVSLRGLGVRFLVEPVGYWDGERGT